MSGTIRSALWLGFFSVILLSWVWLYQMSTGMGFDLIGRLAMPMDGGAMQMDMPADDGAMQMDDGAPHGDMAMEGAGMGMDMPMDGGMDMSGHDALWPAPWHVVGHDGRDDAARRWSRPQNL